MQRGSCVGTVSSVFHPSVGEQTIAKGAGGRVHSLIMFSILKYPKGAAVLAAGDLFFASVDCDGVCGRVELSGGCRPAAAAVCDPRVLLVP